VLRYCIPHLQVDSILELPPSYLLEHGISGMLLDIDGTLKDFVALDVADDVRNWLTNTQAAGIQLCLLSNGKPSRIGPLAQSLGLPHIALAGKPLPRGCHQALELLNLPANRVAIAGDQVFADVLAGRLAGLHSILVRPSSPIEPWFTRLKRPTERWWLRRIESRVPKLRSGNRPELALSSRP
jgi:HAD superfamily phosphatase (TIGR01668 family)